MRCAELTFLYIPSFIKILFDSTTDPPVETNNPTFQPTFSPTLAPSTARPTRLPSVAPSTARPTSVPSVAPSTAQPTNAPSLRPSTARPTMRPSPVPSQSPIIGTRSPVVATENPTLAPSAPRATVSPSGAPTLAVQRYEYAALMFLRFMPGTLTRGQGIDFEVTTEAHIQNAFTQRALDMDDLNVATDVSIQRLLDTTGVGQRRRRHLQNDVAQYILQIDFVVRVTFRSTRTNYDVRTLIAEAFGGDEVARYIQRLKSTSTAFRFVQDVDVLVEGQTAPPQNDDTATESNDVIVYIIAAAGGGCALVLVGLVYLYCSRKSSRKGFKKSDLTTSGSEKSPLGLAAEIRVVRDRDDVSTLGDPMPITTHVSPDEQTASVGNDYDYARDYRQAHSVGSRTNSASLFSVSDNSLDMIAEADPRRIRRFDVTVPPGKLGIVMDNSPSGTPMVYAVKPESVLAGDVQVGDLLLSVDQEDVTVMSAIQVSKLISLKNDKERELVFGRKVLREDAQDL